MFKGLLFFSIYYIYFLYSFYTEREGAHTRGSSYGRGLIKKWALTGGVSNGHLAHMREAGPTGGAHTGWAHTGGGSYGTGLMR